MLESVDSLVNKLRSTVTTTVSNINNILPGNPVTRDYEITRSIASAGPGLLWKIYSGFKKSTKEEASVFVLEKKSLDKLSKKGREQVLDLLRKGVTQLTKIRHPSSLTIQHGLEESRESLAFATEPVFASLSNIFGRCDNIENPLPPDLTKFEFFEIEITYGILQLMNGLSFLHSDVKLLHRNISPENIIINKKGSWKLAGFDFSVQPINPNDFPLKYPSLDILTNHSDFSILAFPNLDFVAPEFILSSPTNDPTLTTSADMFSFGCLLYYVYNKGRPLLPTGSSLNSMTRSRVEQFSHLPTETFSAIPDEIRRPLERLLNPDPTMRPDAHNFAKLEVFDNVQIRTLQYLDSLFQFDNLERSKFYKGLPQIINQMPKRVKLDRVFQGMTKEFVNADMVPFVLPSVFIIAEELNNEEFIECVLPHLTNIFQIKEPIQIPMLLLENMELLLNKLRSNQDSIKVNLLPILCCCLESRSNEVTELCLTTLPKVAHLIDPSSMKNSIISRLKKICHGTTPLSTRVKSLLCVANLLPFFDKWLVLDDVVPFLTSMPCKEPAIIMAIIGILKLVLNNNKLDLTKEVMATKVIPFLMPLTIENTLTSNQFMSVISIIKEMVSLVEKEQKSKLEQLENIKSQRELALVAYTPKSEVTKSAELDFYFQSESTTENSSSSKPKPIDANKSENSFQDFVQSSYGNPVVTKVELNRSINVSKSSSSASINPAPKDLTSSLIDASIRNISTNIIPQRSSAIRSSTAESSMFISQQPPNYAAFSSFPTNINMLTNSTPINYSGSQMSQSGPTASLNSLFSQPSRINASSLDSIQVPGLSKANSLSPSLNSMLGPSALTPTPASNFSGKTSDHGISKLSESDLKEFLS